MEHPMTIAEWQVALDAARAEKAALQARLIDMTHHAERAELALKHLHTIIAEECGKGDPVQAIRALRDRCGAALREIGRQKQIYDELLAQSHKTMLDCLSARTTALTEAAAICRRRAGPHYGGLLIRSLIEAAEEIEGLINNAETNEKTTR